MTDGLSLKGAKCVLEYLETNKRIYIASRSPTLGPDEKSIPLNLEYLILDENSIQLNNIKYEIEEVSEHVNSDDPRCENRPDCEKLKKGDIRIKCDVLNHLAISFKNGNQRWQTIFQLKPEKHEVIRKLINHLLKGREKINVGYFSIATRGNGIIRLPENLSLKISHLDTEVDIRYFLKIINPESFPLKSIRIKAHDPLMLDHPVVESCELLKICHRCGVAQPWLLLDPGRLQHPNVLLETVNLPKEQLIGIIKLWVENEREMGKCFRISRTQQFLDSDFENIMEKFRVNRVKIESLETLPNFPVYSIPINSTANLIIYSIASQGTILQDAEMVLKIMPVEASTILEIDVKNVRERNEKNRNLILIFLLVVFSFILPLSLGILLRRFSKN